MASTAVHGVIYLGKTARMDFDRGASRNAEKAHEVLGGKTFGSPGDPLYGDVLDMTLVDQGNDGYVHFNDTKRNDYISYDVGNGNVQHQVDTLFVVDNVEITQKLPNGDIRVFNGTVRIVQDMSGNSFMVPPWSKANSEHELETIKYPIISVKFPTNSRDYDRSTRAYALQREEFDRFPCFTSGTLIQTAQGPVAVDDLKAGDLVLTQDNGLQPIRWIGSRKLGPQVLKANENFLPIRIRRHALGQNSPNADLTVSPQHRILVRSGLAVELFSTAEILVAAKHLCALEGIEVAKEVESVEYFHILFDRHEVITSNGALTESLYTGEYALKSLDNASYQEVIALFPELADADYRPKAARPLGNGRIGRKLALQHAQDNLSLIG